MPHPLIDLFDAICAEHPQVERSDLARIARGWRVMLREGGTRGTPGMTDEWLCGNDAYCLGFNGVHAAVGPRAAGAIAERIRAVEHAPAL